MSFHEPYYKEKKEKIDEEYQVAKDRFIQITMEAAADLQDALKKCKVKYDELEQRAEESQKNDPSGTTSKTD